MASNQELYIRGDLNTVHQPKPEYMPDTMYSFEVYGDLETGISRTGIPREHWLTFQCDGDVEPIEDPLFLD